MSADRLGSELHDGIRVLTLASPPVNALTVELRLALMQALAAATRAGTPVVIRGEGAGFSSDLPLDPDHGHPDLADLCRAVAESPVPVVALLHGLVTGPGAELALAARTRLADPACRIAFADVALGLCPAGGASQRLPRLVGPRMALELLLGGRAVPVAEALAMGLVDGISEGAALAPALRLAKALGPAGLLPRPRPDPAGWVAAVADARRNRQRRLPAPARIVDCVEAALLLPPETGFAFEAAARADLESTPEAAGLAAAVRAERRALAVPPVLARLQPLTVDRIGLCGASADLARIAVAALSRGVEVTWAFGSEAGRRAGLAAVRAGIGAGQRAGTLAPALAQEMSLRLTATVGPDAMTRLPWVVEDDPADPAVRRETPPGAARLVLGGAPGEIGLALSPGARLCELSLPGETHPLARATALSGLRRIGLHPVLVGPRPLAGARLADAGRTALAWMISRGVPRRMVAEALDGFGMRPPEPVSAEVPAILRAMSAAEVLNRWLAALANEGARLVEQGLVRRPSDIDHLMIAGQGFPRWQGGPMHQADRRGLMVLRADLRAWGAEAALWSPAPLIDRLIREGRPFAALDA